MTRLIKFKPDWLIIANTIIFLIFDPFAIFLIANSFKITIMLMFKYNKAPFTRTCHISNRN